MRYVPQAVSDFRVTEELERIAQAQAGPDVDYVQLKTWYAAPPKVFEGMVALADGTSWDPGSGAGVYCYYGSTWNQLG